LAGIYFGFFAVNIKIQNWREEILADFGGGGHLIEQAVKRGW